MKIGFLVAVSSCLLLSVAAWAVPVAGRVVDENRKPVTGASVIVSARSQSKLQFSPQNLVTDEKGAFSAELPEAAPAKMGDSSLAQLRVVAPGFAWGKFIWKTPGETFALAPGKSWSGTVLGEDEKPLEGVRVAVNWVIADGVSTLFDKDGPSALTDAAGKWKVDNLPLQGSAQVSISDLRYQRQSFTLSLAKPAPPLFARSGAAVRGRLLRPDGTPIVGTLIHSWSSAVEDARSDEQGRFTLSGFAPGAAQLSASNFRSPFDRNFVPAADYVIISKPVAALKAGEVRDIGDWMAQKGTLVSGHVVDKVTKKPVAGASVMFFDQGASSSSHLADEKGYYEVRISESGASSATFSGENHLSGRVNSLSIPKGVATFELPNIELEPGVGVVGKARLEDGSAFEGKYDVFNLTAKGVNNQSQVGRGQTSGDFSFSALRPGKYELSAGSPFGYDGGNKRYDLVSPKSFIVPPVGQKMAPLQIVLKPIPSEAKAPVRLVGRVVNEKGAGVAGAVVSFKNGNNVSPTLAISGEDGQYELSDLSSDAKLSVSNIERPGYVSAAKPAIERQGEVLRVADFVLKRRGARFVGRVLDAQGKPAAGVWVAPLEIEAIEAVKTASDGTFSFLDLPAGDFTLIAAKDRLSATQKTSATATGVELRLAPPATIDTEALVQKWIARGGGYWAEGDFNSSLGVERIEQLALRGAANQPLEARQERIYSWFIAAAARHEPKWTLENTERMLGKLAAGTAKREAESAIALLRAASANPDDQKWAQGWLERQKAETGGISVETVTRYLSMASVARALKRPEAQGLLEFASQIADQLSAKIRLSSAMKWGTQIAPLGDAALTQFLEDWDAPTRLAAWGGAVKGWADAGDIESARRALKTIDALALDPAIKAATAAEMGNLFTFSTPKLVIQGAHSAFVRGLSERDPKAALAEAAFIEDQFRRQSALLWVANGARLRGDKTTATAALRQVFEINIGNTEPYALAAWYSAQIDPALGAELFAQARARVERKSGFGYSPSIGDAAYYLARLDPALSRILVEREWSEREPNLGKPDDFGDLNTGPTKLVRAMLVIDPARGAQMATQLEAAEAGVPDTGGSRGRARTGWISALVADEAALARGELGEPVGF